MQYKMKIAVVLLWGLMTQIGYGATMNVVIGEKYNDSFKIFGKTIHTTPQIAVWLEDSSGRLVKTLKVTRKAAKGKYAGHRGGRVESLPVWAFARGKGKEGIVPDRKSQLPDVITGASKKNSFLWEITFEEQYQNSGYVLWVEVNNSMDFNHYYQKELAEDSPYYNIGVNGQPSLIYKGSGSTETIRVQLVGYGDPAGRNGMIRPIDSTITTALSIIKEITVHVKDE